MMAPLCLSTVVAAEAVEVEAVEGMVEAAADSQAAAVVAENDRLWKILRQVQAKNKDAADETGLKEDGVAVLAEAQSAKNSDGKKNVSEVSAASLQSPSSPSRELGE